MVLLCSCLKCVCIDIVLIKEWLYDEIFVLFSLFLKKITSIKTGMTEWCALKRCINAVAGV